MYNLDFILSYNENAKGTTSNSEDTYYSYFYRETNEIGVSINNKKFTSNTTYYKNSNDPDNPNTNYGYIVNGEYIIKDNESGNYYTYNKEDYVNYMLYSASSNPVDFAVPKPTEKVSASVAVTGFSDPLDKVAVHLTLNDGYFTEGVGFYAYLIPCENPFNIRWVSTVITATGNKNGVLRDIKETTKFTYDFTEEGVTSTWNAELVYEYNVKDCGPYRVHSPVPSEIANYIAANG